MYAFNKYLKQGQVQRFPTSHCYCEAAYGLFLDETPKEVVHGGFQQFIAIVKLLMGLLGETPNESVHGEFQLVLTIVKLLIGFLLGESQNEVDHRVE